MTFVKATLSDGGWWFKIILTSVPAARRGSRLDAAAQPRLPGTAQPRTAQRSGRPPLWVVNRKLRHKSSVKGKKKTPKNAE